MHNVNHKQLGIVLFFICLMFLCFNVSALTNNNATSYAKQGDKYYTDGKYNLAIEAYEKAMGSGYVSTYMFNNLGFIYHYEKKDYKKAEEMFQGSLSINPEESWAHFSLSQLYLDTDNLEKGLEEYKLYVKYDEYKKLPINAERIKEILLKQGKSEEDMANLFKDIIKINSNDYNALIELARYHLKNKQYTIALEEYKKVLELKPQMTTVYSDIGSCYANLGKYELALEYFKKAKESGHYVPDVFFESLKQKIDNQEISEIEGLPIDIKVK